jgi:S1-C subfamily serine protease
VLPGRRATRIGGRGRCCGALHAAAVDAVTAVGNAGGKGGTPTAAIGRVVGLGRDITASDENGTDAERLSGLIQVDAAVQAGDSGGPLYAGGAVIGIDTAAAAAALRAGDTITAVGGVAAD